MQVVDIEAKPPKPLTPKQQRFAHALATDPYRNKTQAAIEAGYPEKSADVMGPRLAANPRVMAVVNELTNAARALATEQGRGIGRGDPNYPNQEDPPEVRVLRSILSAQEWMEDISEMARTSSEPMVRIAAYRLLQPALGTDQVQRKPEDVLSTLRSITAMVLSKEATPEFRREWDRLAAKAMAQLPRGSE